ncbi:MAG TPA: hypothetical protein VKB09_08065 [Thermomicrobiales bacterium]|nr:hypothetical protein [Thermomicrobiales bacterium]
MRVRLIAAVTGLVLLGALVGLTGAPNDARARFQDASPVADTSGTPVANQPSQVVTLVGWYERDADSEVLSISGLTTNEALVARPATGGITGQANFEDPDNDGLPRITIGDSVFDAFPVNPDDPGTVSRWLYYNDEDGVRPATLVMQIECTSSPVYQGFTGTATWISRPQESGSSGVLVIVISPPA